VLCWPGAEQAAAARGPASGGRCTGRRRRGTVAPAALGRVGEQQPRHWDAVARARRQRRGAAPSSGAGTGLQRAAGFEIYLFVFFSFSFNDSGIEIM